MADAADLTDEQLREYYRIGPIEYQRLEKEKDLRWQIERAKWKEARNESNHIWNHNGQAL